MKIEIFANHSFRGYFLQRDIVSEQLVLFLAYDHVGQNGIYICSHLLPTSVMSTGDFKNPLFSICIQFCHPWYLSLCVICFLCNFTYIHNTLRYVSTPCQLDWVCENADGGATWWLYYESCFQGIHTKQITTKYIYKNKTQQQCSHQWVWILNRYLEIVHTVSGSDLPFGLK
jgi:hypothetical protein